MSTHPDRFNSARKAIEAHGFRIGHNPKIQDAQENLIDLLTDLRHWADANEVDLYAALDTSYQHYLTEKGDPIP